MKTILLRLPLLAILAVSMARADDEVAAIPPSVDEYAHAVAAGDSVPVDTLYTVGLRAAADLAGRNGVISDLSDADYDTVVVRMTGFLVNRNEVEYAQPDPAFFLARAKQQSDTASIEFFDAYHTAVPQGILPIYFEPMTDYSGCIKFGSLALVESYGLWTTYRAAYPKRYATQSRDFLKRIETIITVGDCACGDKESVLKELNAFVVAFPAAPITDRVRQRIAAVESDQSHIRYRCSPG
jgi:hypothetical protein